jgi:hypothetical protein
MCLLVKLFLLSEITAAAAVLATGVAIAPKPTFPAQKHPVSGE